ncbi:hypothetical protein SNEBB_008877 [Seison nebaliae]|nr:hypothetical protein SNEBB_008877 [Seison nebaliae]
MDVIPILRTHLLYDASLNEELTETQNCVMAILQKRLKPSHKYPMVFTKYAQFNKEGPLTLWWCVRPVTSANSSNNGTKCNKENLPHTPNSDDNVETNWEERTMYFLPHSENTWLRFEPATFEIVVCVVPTNNRALCDTLRGISTFKQLKKYLETNKHSLKLCNSDSLFDHGNSTNENFQKTDNNNNNNNNINNANTNNNNNNNSNNSGNNSMEVDNNSSTSQDDDDESNWFELSTKQFKLSNDVIESFQEPQIKDEAMEGKSMDVNSLKDYFEKNFLEMKKSCDDIMERAKQTTNEQNGKDISSQLNQIQQLLKLHVSSLINSQKNCSGSSSNSTNSLTLQSSLLQPSIYPSPPLSNSKQLDHKQLLSTISSSLQQNRQNLLQKVQTINKNNSNEKNLIRTNLVQEDNGDIRLDEEMENYSDDDTEEENRQNSQRNSNSLQFDGTNNRSSTNINNQIRVNENGDVECFDSENDDKSGNDSYQFQLNNSDKTVITLDSNVAGNLLKLMNSDQLVKQLQVNNLLTSSTNVKNGIINNNNNNNNNNKLLNEMLSEDIPTNSMKMPRKSSKNGTKSSYSKNMNDLNRKNQNSSINKSRYSPLTSSSSTTVVSPSTSSTYLTGNSITSSHCTSSSSLPSNSILQNLLTVLQQSQDTDQNEPKLSFSSLNSTHSTYSNNNSSCDKLKSLLKNTNTDQIISQLRQQQQQQQQQSQISPIQKGRKRKRFTPTNIRYLNGNSSSSFSSGTGAGMKNGNNNNQIIIESPEHSTRISNVGKLLETIKDDRSSQFTETEKMLIEENLTNHMDMTCSNSSSSNDISSDNGLDDYNFEEEDDDDEYKPPNCRTVDSRMNKCSNRISNSTHRLVKSENISTSNNNNDPMRNHKNSPNNNNNNNNNNNSFNENSREKYLTFSSQTRRQAKAFQRLNPVDTTIRGEHIKSENGKAHRASGIMRLSSAAAFDSTSPIIDPLDIPKTDLDHMRETSIDAYTFVRQVWLRCFPFWYRMDKSIQTYQADLVENMQKITEEYYPKLSCKDINFWSDCYVKLNARNRNDRFRYRQMIIRKNNDDNTTPNSKSNNNSTIYQHHLPQQEKQSRTSQISPAASFTTSTMSGSTSKSTVA